MRVAFLVRGKPMTQGSMTAVYNRRTGRAAIRHTQSLPLMKWRRRIQEAAVEAGARKTNRPVSMSISFGMPRPRSHYNVRGEILPAHQSEIPQYRDLDKLIRAVLDALTGVCYIDDRQVCDLHAIRVYGGDTVIEVNSIGTEDAARMVRATEARSSEGQLPLLLLREKSQ